jgi:uncharacterized protein (DUF1800 family)
MKHPLRPAPWFAFFTFTAFALAAAFHAEASPDMNITKAAWKMLYGVTDTQINDANWLAADSDGDGVSNGDELASGTNPFVAGSSLKVTTVTSDTNNVYLTFTTQLGKLYVLQQTNNLKNGPWTALTPNVQIMGDGTDKTLTAPKAGGNPFFRVLVQDIDTFGDQVSDWAKNVLGMNPSASLSSQSSYTSSTLSSALSTQGVVTVKVTDADATQPPDAVTAANDPAVITIARSGYLLPASITVPLTVSGTAVAGTDYVALPSSVTFPAGVNSIDLVVTPLYNANRTTAATVTVAANPPGSNGSAGNYTVGTPSAAAVNVYPSGAQAGLGLTAEYYLTASSTYTSPINFGGNTVTYTSTATTATVTYNNTNGSFSTGTRANLKFTSGALSGGAFDKIYAITGTSGATFTVPITGGSTSSGNVVLNAPAVTKLEPNVNFAWGYGTPYTGGLMGPSNFSVAWDGYLSPSVAGTYNFQLDALDKARVFLDTGSGLVQILENGWDTTATGAFKQTSSPVTLAVPGTPAARYHFRVEYVHTTGYAKCKLQWSINGGSYVNIPTGVGGQVTTNTATFSSGLIGSYYANTTFTAPVIATQNEAVTAQNNGDWGAGGGSPDPVINANNFCARWSGQVLPQYTEPYTFVVNGDDGCRFYLNGVQQQMHRTTSENPSVTYTYNSGTNSATVNLPTASGLNTGVGDKVPLTFTSGLLSSISGQQVYVITAVTSSTFTVSIPPGTYTGGGTGSNVTVNTLNMTYDWGSFISGDRYCTVNLVAGVFYDIKLEYYEASGNASCVLSWYSDDVAKQAIPTSQLFPTITGATPKPGNPPAAPTAITSPSTAIAVVGGGAFNFTLSSSNGGGNYTSTGLPSWLTLNSATGLLSGTPTQAGTYSFTITATNAAGSGSQAITITVLANPGNFTRDLFTSGFTGAGVNDVPWLSAPNSTDTTLTSLEDTTAYGNNTGERLRGYFTPTTTGNYYFWISANNNAELWISNNGESCNKVRRAVVTGPTGSASRTWNTQTTQKSAWLSLTAGQKYYLEALHNTGAGGASSNLAVGWFLDPTGNTANPIANGAGPSSGVTGGIIPGYVLSPWDNPPTTSVSGSIYITDLSPAPGVNGAKGSGGAFLRVNGSTGLLHLNYSGLTSGATSRRIYAMPVGNNPPTLLFDIDAQDRNYPGLKSSDGAYTWTMQASDLTALNSGTAYLSIATTNNPGGELVGTFGLTTGSQAAPALPSYPSYTDDHATDAGVTRFLAQATYGAAPGSADPVNNPSDRDYVKSHGYDGWIQNQFSAPVTHNVPYILANLSNDPQNPYSSTLFFNSWWKNAITAPDQLRQRVAFALSEITVVSDTGPLNNNGRTLADYYDSLLDYSFDNYRNILKQVTLTSAMGLYLDMLQNQKGNAQTGLHPNENYAREIMQLFSIGLYHLWPDGTLMLDSTGLPVATYDQTVITGMARVFTGWSWGQALGAGSRLPTSLFPSSNYLDPMLLVPNYHELGTKILLDNAMLPAATVLLSNDFTQDPNPNPVTVLSMNPAGQGNPVSTNITNSYDLNGLHDLEAALDSIMNNPALGPFICRQLIQRLVTSNPKPDYVYRVVRAFNGERNVDGVATGVRGDMKEVIRAILLDYEARSTTAAANVGFGKQREPLLRVTGPVRAFPPTTITGATYRQNGGQNLMVSTASPHRLTSDTVFLNSFVDGGASTTNLPNAGGYSANATPGYTHTVVGGNVTYSCTTTTATINGSGFAVGNQVYLSFTSGSRNGVANTFTISSATGSNFTVSLAGTGTTSGNVTIALPYSSTGSSATISGATFAVGTPVYVKFTVGTLSGGTYDKAYTVNSATTNSFTITLGGSPPASSSGACQTAQTSINVAGYQAGDVVPIQFTGGNLNVSPFNTVQSYTVLGVNAAGTAFYVSLGSVAQATSSSSTVTPNNFTTANPAAPSFAYTFSGTAVTLNLSGVPNIAGRQMYVKFTTGSLAGQGYDGLYNITSTDATHVYFTLGSAPTGTTGGNAIIPRFTGGYNIVNASGTSTIYIQTNVAHSLKVGDPVWIDFLVTNAGTPAVSQAYNVASVGPSPNTFTVTVTPSVSAGSQSTTGQAVYPLAIDTWTRNGTCNVNFSTWNMGYTQSNIIQTPLDSTTVFNFFYPDYHYPGAMAAAGMTTPEFQLTNDSNTMNLTNFLTSGITSAGNPNGFTSFQGGGGSLVMDMGPYLTQAQTSDAGIPATVDALSVLLVGNNLNSATRTAIISYVANTTNFPLSGTPTNQQMRDRVRAIVHQIILSAEYAIQK